jgi:Ni,Fe-hydrogenase III large subunit
VRQKKYKIWRKENKKLLKKAKKFLDEFYKNREVHSDIKLEIEIFGNGSFRIQNGGKYYKPVNDLSRKEKREVKKMLEKFREEMNAFTEFLKNKYFSPRFKLPKIKI